MKQPASFHGSSIIALYTFAELPRTAWRLQLMISEDNPLPMCSPEAVAPRRPLSHICRQHCTSLNRKQCRISEARMVTASIIPALIATSFVFLEVLSTPLLIKHFFFFSDGNLLSSVGHVLWMKALFADWRDGSEVRKTYFMRGPELGFLFPYSVAHKFLELLIRGPDTAFWSLWVSPYTCMRSHLCTHVLNTICFGLVMGNLNLDVLLSIMHLAEV